MKWTTRLDTKLLELKKAGFTNKAIATKFETTTQAIKMRLHKLGYVKQKPWTQHDIDLLRDIAENYPRCEIKRVFNGQADVNRTQTAIDFKIWQLGIVPNCDYSIQYLNKRTLSQMIGLSVSGVIKFCNRHKIGKIKNRRLLISTKELKKLFITKPHLINRYPGLTDDPFFNDIMQTLSNTDDTVCTQYTKWTDALDNKLLELKKAGLTNKAIAKELKMTKNQIDARLHKKGWTKQTIKDFNCANN